jgi:hypothetical protein
LVRPEWYGKSRRLDTIPLSPMPQARLKNQLTIVVKVFAEVDAVMRTAKTLDSLALRSSSGRGRQSSPSTSIRSKAYSATRSSYPDLWSLSKCDRATGRHRRPPPPGRFITRRRACCDQSRPGATTLGRGAPVSARVVRFSWTAAASKQQSSVWPKIAARHNHRFFF